MEDIAANPANISKYQSNAKFQKILERMAKNFKGGPDISGAFDAGSSVPESGRSSAQPTAPPQPDID